MRRTLIAGLTVLATLACGLPLPGEAAAQEPDRAGDWRPARGDRSIAFAVPESGAGTIALWWHRSRDAAVGLQLGFSADAGLRTGGDDPDQFGSDASVSLGPAFKSYRGHLGPVAPYFATGFGLSGFLRYRAVDDPAVDPRTLWGAGAYVRMGVGVDWFVAERVSIGGHIGGRISYRFRPGREAADPDIHTLDLGTRTGGLTFHLYF